MKNNDWKDRLGVMYSTNPDFQYNTGDEVEEIHFPKRNNNCVSRLTSGTGVVKPLHW